MVRHMPGTENLPVEARNVPVEYLAALDAVVNDAAALRGQAAR